MSLVEVFTGRILDTSKYNILRFIVTMVHGGKTDDNGNAMFQSYLPNYSKKKPAEDTLVPPLWGTREKNGCFSRVICSRCCTRRNLRFHVENCPHPDQKQLTRRKAFDLDIEATHCQPGSCRARPVSVHDGLEGITWIRGLGGEICPRRPTLFSQT